MGLGFEKKKLKEKSSDSLKKGKKKSGGQNNLRGEIQQKKNRT